MLTREPSSTVFSQDVHLLDGATGTMLRAMGMPKSGCAAEWILTHPEFLIRLQRNYADAGSEIVYAPTFRCQPLAALSRKADCRESGTSPEYIAAIGEIRLSCGLTLSFESSN